MKLSKVFVTAHDIKRSDKLSSHYPIAEPKTTTTTPTIADMDLELIENYDGKLSIYYGSSMGTCEDLAQRVCDETKQLGFDASVRPLDFAASEGFEKDSLVIIVTSTYNGYPPDNAKKFAEYCKNLEPNSLQGVKVAIIGIGNSIWKSFQAFPPFIEFALRSAGAEILCERGVADEEKDIQGDIDSRVDSEFWPSVFEAVGLKPYTSAKRASIDRYYSDVLELVVTDSTRQSHHPLRSAGNKLATVVSARELHSPSSDRSARHVEFKLPIGMDYHEGDHLAIFPENDSELVLRVASLLKEHDLGRVAMMTAASNDDTAFRHLPLGIPIKVSDLLGRYVDLQAPITTSFVNVAVLSAADFEQAEALKGIAELICDGVIGDWQQLRPLQILTAFPSVQMTLENALATIAPMKKRYYSISSSSVDSKIEPQIDSVTVGLIEGASVRNHTILAAAQLDSEKFRGVSSGYLADIRPGQLVEVSVVKNDRFRLPNDTSIPIIMIGAGTGLAPFRGFIQAMNAEVRGRRQAMLFFGCRNENDYIYRSELESAPCNTKF
jgi:cytochrome P450/NADPH-cytochrome P450 reductase